MAKHQPAPPCSPSAMPAPAPPGRIEPRKRPARTLQQREEQLWDNIMLRYVARPYSWDAWERRLRENQDDRVVFEALRALGLAALRTSRSEDPDDHIAAVQDLLWERIRAWYVRARRDDFDDRRGAARLLEQLGSTLAGGNRGRKRKPAAHPAIVLYTYKRNVLRLRTAIGQLGSTRRGPASDSLVKKIADACSVSLERFHSWIARYSYRDLDTQRLAKALRQDVMREARVWAASEHQITEQTVSNIVSELKRSRK